MIFSFYEHSRRVEFLRVVCLFLLLLTAYAHRMLSQSFRMSMLKYFHWTLLSDIKISWILRTGDTIKPKKKWIYTSLSFRICLFLCIYTYVWVWCLLLYPGCDWCWYLWFILFTPFLLSLLLVSSDLLYVWSSFNIKPIATNSMCTLFLFLNVYISHQHLVIIRMKKHEWKKRKKTPFSWTQA